MKITYSSEDIHSFGGINFADHLVRNASVYQIIDQTLGGQLSPKHEGYIFDYDNQFIPTDKYDSKRSYKHADGYFPRIASIGNFPVYIENRNGNSNVKYKQEETLKRGEDLSLRDPAGRKTMMGRQTRSPGIITSTGPS